MTVTATRPFGPADLTAYLNQHTGITGTVTVTGNPSQPGATVSSTTWSDALISAALAALPPRRRLPGDPVLSPPVGRQGGTALNAAPIPWLNVKDFGALGDGATDDTAAITAAITACVAAGGGLVMVPAGVYVCNNATPSPIFGSSGTVTIRGAGKDVTLLKATTATINSVLNLQGNVSVEDLTIDGGGVAVNALAITVPNGQTAARAAVRRARCGNVSTTVGFGPGWALILWGQATATNGYNLRRAYIEDVEVYGPTHPSYDCLSVTGVDTCFVNNLTIDGVARTPNFYVCRQLFADGIRCTNFTTTQGLVIDATIAHGHLSHVYSDASAQMYLNCPDLTVVDSQWDSVALLNYGNTAPNQRFIGCKGAGFGLEAGPIGTLELVGGDYGFGGNDVIADLTPAGTVHGPITITAAMLGPTAHGNVIRSFNGTTHTLRMTDCLGYSTGRTLYDGVTTAGSNIITSASAAFTAADVGRSIEDTVGNNQIPAGTTITSVTNATTAVMSAPATASQTGDIVSLGGLAIALSNYNTTLSSQSRVAATTGWNPVGHAVTQPAVPASGTPQTNSTGVDCTVFVAGGVVSAVAIGGTATGATSGAFRVPAGQNITLTYTTAPTWQWFGD
ncbi:MAG TPA: glycosyl hydrolase family 28-related protein [Acidimicrobiales bacterium]|nr:glycosyl hydrolase family 28-related protein [Acidimicrobiales bacterium]